MIKLFCDLHMLMFCFAEFYLLICVYCCFDCDLLGLFAGVVLVRLVWVVVVCCVVILFLDCLCLLVLVYCVGSGVVGVGIALLG